MNYIIDEEINLEEKDYLNSKQYAKALKDIIDSAPKNKVFTIGFFGSWGTGKSSIIKTTEELYKNDKSVKFIKYDAWQYGNDSFRRTFLITLCDQMSMNKDRFLKSFYNKETKDIKFEHKLSPFAIVCLIIGFVLSIFVLPFNPIDQGIKITSVMAFTLLSTIFTIITKLTDTYKTSITEEILFAPEQFSECFKKIIDDFFNKEQKKLIIIIDNIDRCQGESVYRLLTDIKTFLGNENKDIIFLIPVDDVELKKQIFSNTIDNKENEEFLRKSFNTVLRIKPYIETDMYEFAKKLAKDNNLQFNEDVIYLASKKYSKNPRRIVQLYNNLLSEFAFYENKEFVESKQALICICLIIREEYFDFYKLLIDTPSILKDQTLIIKNEENKEITNMIHNFLLISESIIKKFSVADIEKVLSNTESIFSNIPESIQSAISNFDSNLFLTEIKLHTNEISNINGYLIYKLTSAVNKKNVNEVANLLNFIAILNRDFNFENILQNLDGQFIHFGYENIIELVNDYDSTCEFIEYLSKKGFSAAKESLIKILTLIPGTNNQIRIAKDLFDSTTKYCTDEKTSKELVEIFEFLYKNSDDIHISSQAQYDHMISNNYISHRIDNIQAIQSVVQPNFFLKSVFQRKTNYTKEVVEKYLQKINSLFLSNQGKTFEVLHEEMIIIIDILTPFIQNIEIYNKVYTEQIKKHLQKIHDYFLKPRNVQGSSRYYLNEIINNDQYLTDAFTLIKYVYILSDESINMQDTFNILKGNKSNKLLFLYFDILTIHKKTLKPIFNHILEIITSLDTKEKLTIFEHCCFLKNPNNSFKVTLQQISTKYNYLFNFSEQKDEKEKLILKLCNEPFFNESICNALIARGEDFINSLSPSILSKLINIFSEKTKDVYKNNYAFLSIVAEKGEKEQKSIVANLMIHNIHNRIDISNSLLVIEKGKFNNIIKKELISTLERYLTEAGDNIAEEVKERINKIIKE